MANKTWISTSSTDFATAGNWNPSGAPASGDTIYFVLPGTANVTTSLNQSSLTGCTVIIEDASPTQIGSFSGGVATYLQLGGGTFKIGGGTGIGVAAGSSRLMFDTGGTAATYTILNTAVASVTGDANVPPLQLKGTAITINAYSGNIGVAVRSGETSTVTSLTTTIQSNRAIPNIYLGTGVTLTALSHNAGTIHSRSAQTLPNAVLNGGTYRYAGTGSHTNITANTDSIIYYDGSGGVTGNFILQGGKFNGSGNAESKTFANTYLYSGEFNIDNGVAGSFVFTNPIQYPNGFSNLTLIVPAGVKGSLTNI
jgi:hypothetical protein